MGRSGVEGPGHWCEAVLGSARRGEIWQKRPKPTPDGAILIVYSAPLAASRSRGVEVEFRAVAWDENSRVFAAADERGQVYMFQPYKNTFTMVRGAGPEVATLHFVLRRKARELVLGCVDGAVLVLDTVTRDIQCNLRGTHELAVHSLSSHPHRAAVLSASEDAMVVWATNSVSSGWIIARQIGALGGGIVKAEYTATGDHLLALLRDGYVVSWDSVTFVVQYSVAVCEADANNVHLTAMHVATDGMSMVVGDSAGRLHLYSTTPAAAADAAQPPQLLRIADMPPSCKRIMDVSHWGDRVVVIGDDGRALFLDLTARYCAIRLELQSPLQALGILAIEPSGRYALAGLSDKTLRLYDLKSRAAKAMAKAPVLLESRAPRASDGTEDDADDQHNSLQAPTMKVRDSRLQTAAAPDILDSVFPPTEARKSGRRAAGAKNHEDAAVEAKGGATSAGRWQWESLFKLASDGQRLDVTKLRALLHAHGHFPEKHRLLIWKFLLRLPENAAAYASLQAKGLHPAYARLEDSYPLRSEVLLKRLKLVCSALGHWSPIMGELEYVPVVVFPFVVLFKGDDLCAFEASMCVLVHWQRGFVSTYPAPPINVLSTLEHLLKVHDPVLRDHLIKVGLDAQGYGWAMLRSIFTEVFARSDWLRLWDHLLVHAERPELLLFAALAVVMHNRRALLEMDDKGDMEALLRRQTTLDVGRVISTMHRLQAKTTPDILAPLAPDPPTGTAAETASPTAAASTASAVHEAVAPIVDPWPLPPGPRYPSLEAAYPKYVVDYQIKERARMAVEEEGVRRKREYLDELSKRTIEAARAEQTWQAEKELLLEAEEKRRKEADDLYQHRLVELQRLDEQSRARRLECVTTLESGAQKSLEVAKRLREAEARRVNEEVEKIKQRNLYELQSREEEEKLAALERQVQERVSQAILSRYEEERLREMRADLDRRRQLLELEDRRVREQWATEDAERAARARARQQMAEQLMHTDSATATQSELEQMFMAAQAEREIKIAGIERDRRLRRLEEEHAVVQEDTKLARIREIEQERKGQKAALEAALRETRAKELAGREERLRELEQQQKLAQEEAEARRKRIQEAERGLKQNELEDRIVNERQKEMEKALAQEKDVQQMMLDMERERMLERQRQLRDVCTEEEKAAMQEFQSALQEAEARILQQERQRFEALRDELRQQGAEQEADFLQRHEMRLKKIEEDKEMELDDLEEGIFAPARPATVHLRNPTRLLTTSSSSSSSNGASGVSTASHDDSGASSNLGAMTATSTSSSNNLQSKDSLAMSSSPAPTPSSSPLPPPRVPDNSLLSPISAHAYAAATTPSSQPTPIASGSGSGGGAQRTPMHASSASSGGGGLFHSSGAVSTPSLEEALNLEGADSDVSEGISVASDGEQDSLLEGGGGNAGGSSDSDDSVVRKARRILQRHREIKQQAGRGGRASGGGALPPPREEEKGHRGT